MATIEKPHQQVEWVPIFFILGACYIVTLICLVRNLTDVSVQGALGIATTFAGAAGGAYAPQLLQRISQRRATDTPDPSQAQSQQTGS